MLDQNTPHNVFININAKGIGDHQCDAGTAKAGIAPFDFDYRLAQVTVGTLGPGFAFMERGKEQPILPFNQCLVKGKQGGGLHNDRGSDPPIGGQ
jgi:hypothetical protein